MTFVYWGLWLVLGILLMSMGFSAFTWQYWAVLVITGAIALVLERI